MANVHSGFLSIADITGYTAYLNASELEHAEDSLHTLLNLLIEHTRLPQVISRLEGDAVISYALEGSFLQGQTLVEMMENTYLAFKQALDLMIVNTTCDCNACRNLSNLDLKIFVYYGTFMLQKLPVYTELVGSDVNLIHRLTKNSVAEKTGIKAYILFTEAAVEHLGIQEEIELMTRHTESYEHIGEVVSYVRDMHKLWKEQRDRVRISVQPEDAIATIEARYPVPLFLMWDYVTKPEYKAILANSSKAVADGRTNGRIGLGATYYCAHGDSATRQTIVDWQPPHQYTYVGDPMMGATCYITTWLIPDGDHTRVMMTMSKFQGGRLPARMAVQAGMTLMWPFFKRQLRQAMHNLLLQIEQEIAQGEVVQPEAATVPAAEIEKSISESLATT